MHAATPWVGVEAILRGTALEQDLHAEPSRWRLVRGVPVAAQDGGRRTLAGAMTLTCTQAPEDCPLSVRNAPAHLLPEIDRLLAASAAGVFSP
jgi:hypothetical protein